MTTSTADELIEQLKRYRPLNEWGDGVRHVICDEAATLLEQYAARIRELEEALKNASGLLDNAVARRRYRDDPLYDEVVASIRAALGEDVALREEVAALRARIDGATLLSDQKEQGR